MKSLKKYSAVLLLLLFGLGCKKAIQLAPFNSVPSTEAFSTAAKCLTSLNGVYDAAQSGAYTDGTIRGYPFGAANIEQGDARGEDVINIAAFFQVTYQATYNSTAANVVGHWNALYALINKANISIDGFRDATLKGILAPSVGLQYEAECRFLRAMSHHELMLMWARPYLDGNGSQLGIPYRDFAVSDLAAVERVRTLPRDRSDTVYKRILRDLDYAETNLPAAPQLLAPLTTADKPVRATKAAAIALKMRVKMHMGDWTGVLAEGNKLIPAVLTPLNPAGVISPIGSWALTPSPDGPFTNNASTENIFSIRNKDIDNTGVNGALPAMLGAANLGARGLVAVSPILWNNTGWRCDDTRRSLLYVSGTNANNGTSLFTTKYRDYVNRSDFAPQIRYAEVLLMQAEAEARVSGAVTQRSVDLLNMVRNRAIPLPATNQYVIANFATVVDLIKAILFERRIEFLFEGKRWPDISRLAMEPNYTTNGIPAKMANGAQGAALYGCGTPVTTGQAAIPYADYRFIWPIPNDEIVQNPIISQNSGY
ncbi:MAG TPA: RagB/SusD family nutrient uptake outer membrane protein [Chitinophagaceae bacterium]|nr:RagB/SusD family nutrient uptake outer membrane protein [Chitinophagaceae bacterium]